MAAITYYKCPHGYDNPGDCNDCRKREIERVVTPPPASQSAPSAGSGELPELPVGFCMSGSHISGYTADQMRAYGKLCRRLATAGQPAIDLDACVDRFLGWRLPDDFAPDDGISFTPITNPAWTHDNWPIGTNLLTAAQARTMLEYVLNWTAGAPSAQQPLDGPANNAGVATGSRNGPPSESVTRGNPPSTPEQPGSSVQGEDWQQRCLDLGFKYWRAPDAHGVECTHEQARGLLRDLLGVEVDFTTPPPAPAAEVDDALSRVARMVDKESEWADIPWDDWLTIRAHIEALEAMSEKRRVTLITMTEDRTAQRRRAEAAEARVRELGGDARAWRNRFISERTSTYRGEGHGYEMATAKAEADANDYIDAFHSAMQGEEVRGA